jgi:hypothetical protein
MIRTPRLVVTLVAAVAVLLVATPAAAHEAREVGPYTVSVGFRGEPVYAGNESGLELRVTRGEEPVSGLSDSLEAEVTYPGFPSRPLELAPIFQQPGAYESPFVPTSAGAYTFRIFGSIEGMEIDEVYNSADGRFDSVKDAGEAQYPILLPPLVAIEANAVRGAEAADQVPLALGLGTAGLIIGLASIALSLAGRRRGA